jgi:FMN phosphatase YigB (HAD superfamily)
LDYFDAATFSDEVGCFKPDPRMFRDALRKLDSAPTHDVAHVGDGRRTDVAGALAMGVLAVRFAGVYDDQNDNEGPSGDLVVRSYPELASAVGLA